MAESHRFLAIGLQEQRFSEEIENFAFLVRVALLSHPCWCQVKLLLLLGLVVLRWRPRHEELQVCHSF